MTDDDTTPAGRSFFIEVVLAGLVVFIVAVTIGLVTGAKTGSVAEWVAAIGTLAAFVAAVIAARYAANVVHIERRRDQLRDDSLERTQAEMVAVWGEVEQSFSDDGVDWLAGVGSAKMIVWNTSQLPIYNVDIRSTLTLKVKGQPERAQTMHATPRVIAPGKEYWLALADAFQPLSSLGPMGPEHIPYTVDFDITVVFDDNAARRWRRPPAGPVERVHPA